MNLAIAMASIAIKMETAYRDSHLVFCLQARRFEGGACFLDDFDREGMDASVKK